MDDRERLLVALEKLVTKIAANQGDDAGTVLRGAILGLELAAELLARQTKAG